VLDLAHVVLHEEVDGVARAVLHVGVDGLARVNPVSEKIEK